MDQDFDIMQLPDAPDAVAPDGSDVRVPGPGEAYDVPGAWPADSLDTPL